SPLHWGHAGVWSMAAASRETAGDYSARGRTAAGCSPAPSQCLVGILTGMTFAPGGKLRFVVRQFLGVDIEHAAVAAAFAAVECQRLLGCERRQVGWHVRAGQRSWLSLLPRRL